MRRLVLKAILLMGRYAVLPVVALAGALLMVWLMAIDRYTISALVAAPVVFCAATAAVALRLKPNSYELLGDRGDSSGCAMSQTICARRPRVLRRF